MNNINITINLSEEDRARLDKIAEHLEHLVNGEAQKAEPVKATIEESPVAETVETVNPPEIEEEAQTDELVNPAEEEAEAQTAEPVKEPEILLPPIVTHEDIRKKAVQLAGNGKAAEAGDIILACAPCISAIPEDKLDEVFAKLSALEGDAQ